MALFFKTWSSLCRCYWGCGEPSWMDGFTVRQVPSSFLWPWCGFELIGQNLRLCTGVDPESLKHQDRGGGGMSFRIAWVHYVSVPNIWKCTSQGPTLHAWLAQGHTIPGMSAVSYRPLSLEDCWPPQPALPHCPRRNGCCLLCFVKRNAIMKWYDFISEILHRSLSDFGFRQ